MAKIKAFIASVMCGLSTFTIMPNTNYADFVPQSPNAISKAAWFRTGNALRKSIDKVGKRLAQQKQPVKDDKVVTQMVERKR